MTAVDLENVTVRKTNRPAPRGLGSLLGGFALVCAAGLAVADEPAERGPRQISGVYPHLTTYGVYSQHGAHFKSGHDECGIGALVPWAGKRWMVNYAPHMPRGSEHKLYSISPDLNMTIHPESVGGTPAGRMIHRESNQLLIGHHAIDAERRVRTIPPEKMPIRVTAIARHLSDPANKVYYIDMEGSIWEADVHSLEVERLFEKPVPGWHSKGGYTGQGRLIVSNNGEHAAGSYDDLLVGGPAKNDEQAGVLAEWDGQRWRIVERRQYTEVTGPKGILGGGDGDDPVWAVGWDRRSLRLKVLDDGTWHTYLLPKAALCNDARHGWYTEWPRIRAITGGRWMMDMHGMFFDFPQTFSAEDTSGLKPIGTHLRYIPDFCAWNDRLVLATDETSIQGNRLAGQPQSNLWFGRYEDLKTWGPANGYGGPWIEDRVAANTPSDPFLVAGFDRRVLHLATGRKTPLAPQYGRRASDEQPIHSMPAALAELPRITVPRGDWHEPAPGYAFRTDAPVTVYLAVDQRGQPNFAPAWQRTNLTLTWGRGGHYRDVVYRRDFPAGTIEIPANDTEHTPGAFGMPHTAFVSADSPEVDLEPLGRAHLTPPPQRNEEAEVEPAQPVVFSLQVDVEGDGHWEDYGSVNVPADGYVCHVLPEEFEATWLRLKTDRDCIATAQLHQTTSRYRDGAKYAETFAGLAPAGAGKQVHAARVYAAKRNRNLRVITGDGRHFDFTKGGFEFKAQPPDEDLAELLRVEPGFTVDEASVVLHHGGQTLRLPKGPAAFSESSGSMRPRWSREVESERHLANIHGTFYEVPLITNGQPPAYRLMRPVASHAKQITDYCSWNGLLVLAGVRRGAPDGEHVFADPKQRTGLWFGAIDDLWKLGKPVGRGGPWKRTAVKAGEPSDPYLMTGYDQKTLTLSADRDTTVAIEIDIDHQSGWHRYRTVDLAAGERKTIEFPEAFSAHWIRFAADRDCTATAQLVYR